MRTLLLAGVVSLLATGCIVGPKPDGGTGGDGGVTGGGGGAVTGGGGGAVTGGGGGAVTGGGGGVTGGGGGAVTGGGGGAVTGGGGGATGGGGGGVPCPGCASGACDTDGGCFQCVNDTHCSGATSRCEVTSHSCVQCLPTDDTCGVHEYCTGGFVCVPGCKADGACQSGRCLPTRDCFECLSDAECAGGRVCGTGVCGAPCTGTTCADGGACCAGHCVELARDDAHCGACNNACGASAFCNGTTCRAAAVSSVCEAPFAVVVLDGLRDDDDAGVRLARTYVTGCAPPLNVTVVPIADAGAWFDVATGQPWARGGAALGLMGGPFRQSVVSYLERTGVAQVSFDAVGTDLFFRRSDGGVVVQAPMAAPTASHDWFILELVKEPLRGSPSLIGYGFSGAGTIAAHWFLEHQVVPTRSAWTKSWYVVEWTDTDASGEASAGDTFTQLASGP